MLKKYEFITEQSIKDLNENGFVKLGKVFNYHEIKLLNKLYENIDNEGNYWCKISENQNSMLIRKNQIKKNNKLINIFKQKDLFVINTLSKKYLSKEIEFEGIFFADTIGIQSKRNSLPFIPHIDKHHRIKIMIYLTNVDKNSGPLEVWPKTNKLYYKERFDYRKQNKTVSKFNNVKNVSSNPLKLDGSAGEVFIFDTDILHQAGSANYNIQRRVIRLDFISKEEKRYEKEKNPINIIKNFIYLHRSRFPKFYPLFRV